MSNRKDLILTCKQVVFYCLKDQIQKVMTVQLRQWLKYGWVLFMALGIVVGSVPAYAQRTLSKKERKRIHKLLKKAWKPLTEQPPSFQEAMEYLKEALRIDPNQPQANAILGVYALQGPDKTDAIPYLQKAIQYGQPEQDFPKEIYYLLGWTYHLTLQLDSAQRYYELYKQLLRPDEREERRTWNIIYLTIFGRLGTQYQKDVPLPQPYQLVEKRLKEVATAKRLVKNPVPIKVINLGDSVNSPYPEYAPIITADESMIFFTARRPENVGKKVDPYDGLPFEDVWVAEKRPSGAWGKAYNLPKPINSELHESVIGISPDGQTLYLYKTDNGGDIYVSHLKGNKWSKPKPLPKPINSKYSEKSIAIFPDGKRMLFVSTRPGGYGGRDIWVAEKNKKGKWKIVYNAGPVLNTPYDEDGIFLHPDGKTLYFSSKGHETMGGYDIFKSVYENGKWSKPVNIGYPVNTTGDDIYFVMSADGKRGYYSSLRADSKGDKDLYMIEFQVDKIEAELAQKKVTLKEKAKLPLLAFRPATPVTLVKGKVYDSLTREPLEAQVVVLDNATGDTVRSLTSNAATGKFVLTLPAGKNYGLAVSKEGYLFYSANFDIPPTAQYKEVTLNVPLIPIRVGAVVALRNIFFEFDKAELKPESYPELDRVVELMKKYPNIKVEIAGHTDSIGSEAYNLRLSQRRAEAVVRYLVSKGISPDRLIAKGYGESQPIAPNDTEEGRALNRRVEFRIIED